MRIGHNIPKTTYGFMRAQDTNSNGFIGQAEFMKSQKSAGHSLADAQRNFLTLDTNHDGLITKQEIAANLLARRK